LAGKQYGQITDHCTILDTLPLARQLHPGQRNSLDALCKRYSIDNSHRNLHGALLDAELLTGVYLAMTGGQTTLFAEETTNTVTTQTTSQTITLKSRPALRIIEANPDEIASHNNRIAAINKASNGKVMWK